MEYEILTAGESTLETLTIKSFQLEEEYEMAKETGNIVVTSKRFIDFLKDNTDHIDSGDDIVTCIINMEVSPDQESYIYLMERSGNTSKTILDKYEVDRLYNNLVEGLGITILPRTQKINIELRENDLALVHCTYYPIKKDN